MLLQAPSGSSFSVKSHHLKQPGGLRGKSRKLESPARQACGVAVEYRKNSRRSLYLNCLMPGSGGDCKPADKFNVPATLHHDDDARGFQDFNLHKKLNAVYRLTRPYSIAGTVVGITSVCFLPLQTFADLTPKFFLAILKVLVPTIFIYFYQNILNQVYDIEIDKINKPYLPLASGELSMEFGIASAYFSLFMCFTTGIMFQSPALLSALVVIFLVATAYSIDLPCLRWKRNSFLTSVSLVIMRGLVFQFAYFIHIQKYVLGRRVVITRQLIFTSGLMSCLVVVIGLIKDIPDVDGDEKFGLQNSVVTFGKERVFWVCVYMLVIAYGGAAIVGASSSFLLGKLVSIIGHSTVAFLVCVRARTLDLSDDVAAQAFYMFIWKLYFIEYLLVHFLR